MIRYADWVVRVIVVFLLAAAVMFGWLWFGVTV